MRKRIRNYQGRDFGKVRAPDKLGKKSRSILMSKIRSRGTKFEQDFSVLLKKRTDKKFTRNPFSIRGKPDIVFKNDWVCVFLDSDFWHGWQYPRWKHLLKDNFWRKKIENNRRRDKLVTKYLRGKSWMVLRFWEYQIKKNSEQCVQKILKFL